MPAGPQIIWEWTIVSENDNVNENDSVEWWCRDLTRSRCYLFLQMPIMIDAANRAKVSQVRKN